MYFHQQKGNMKKALSPKSKKQPRSVENNRTKLFLVSCSCHETAPGTV
jgi:hypothetical protein